MLATTMLHLFGLDGNITVRVKTNHVVQTIISGSHPTVDEVALILHGYNDPSAHRLACTAVYNSPTFLKLPMYNWQSTSNNQTLAASTASIGYRYGSIDYVLFGVHFCKK